VVPVQPPAGPPGTGGSGTTTSAAITTAPKDPKILDELQAYAPPYPSQIVTFTSKYINKLSDVANAMNISGSLSIKYGEISGGGSGSYVGTSTPPFQIARSHRTVQVDSDTFIASELNYLVSVKVINQTINVKDQLDFYPLNEHKDAQNTIDFEQFTKVYGDSFISGFQEGGSFIAIVSIKSLDTSNLTDIKANAHLALQVGVGSLDANADVSLQKQALNKQAEVSITVNWSGGGQLKRDTDKWSIDTLMASPTPSTVQIRSNLLCRR
jgi:hypothetical protein